VRNERGGHFLRGCCTKCMEARRQLRIAMVIDEWDDASNGGVVSTQRFTKLLRQRGHVVTVIAGGRAAAGKIGLPPFYLPLVENRMRQMRFMFAWPKRQVLKAAFARQDLIHVQTPFYLGMQAITMARKAGLPVVSSFHVQAENVLHNIGIRSEGVA